MKSKLFLSLTLALGLLIVSSASIHTSVEQQHAEFSVASRLAT
ncbi:hypothetical protein [Bacillus haynesii]|nr:hypothetical protein [Bacillus haynesii]MEC1576317.1 hypothetical protein [Bacillus haynesii]